MGYETVILMSAATGARFHFRLTVALLLACLATVGFPVWAQSPSPSVPILQLNQPITGNLKDGELHTYKLHAEAGMLVRVQAMQQGVDVAVRALDPQRTRLAGSEDSFGRVGPQILDFLAESTGVYFYRSGRSARRIGRQL